MTEAMRLTGLHLLREKNGFRFEMKVPYLSLEHGRMMAVVGPSGCGKSTLLDVLALILRPETTEEFVLFLPADDASGSILDLRTADDATLAAVRGAHIGYVLQSGGLLSFLSVKDNILLPARLAGLSVASVQKDFDELVTRLGIADQLEKKPAHLSGGQRQRVAIARALIARPGIVLADEPTAAVDEETASDICAIFKELARDWDSALVVVSHDRDLMARYADSTTEFHMQRPDENHVSVTVTTGVHTDLEVRGRRQ